MIAARKSSQSMDKGILEEHEQGHIPASGCVLHGLDGSVWAKFWFHNRCGCGNAFWTLEKSQVSGSLHVEASAKPIELLGQFGAGGTVAF
ncbi:hypothetical protein OIU84_005262 [Salix udensis]|uniref:Uncharacterized protein n=1 Tax=Salix udensis TaxID=889485 RepID=A0AAD6P0K3_9ROSI|nr:hypothetical protein OIU84_005262 [Salix udensis]